MLPWIPCFFFLYTAQPYSEMEHSGIELLHGWTQPKRAQPEKQGSSLPVTCFVIFRYTAQPYNEMEHSGIELLHG